MRNSQDKLSRTNSSSRPRGDRNLEARLTEERNSRHWDRGEDYGYQQDMQGRENSFARQNFSSDRDQDVQRERGYGNYSSYNSDRQESDRGYRNDGSASRLGMRNSEDFHPRQNFNSNKTSFGGEKISQEFSQRQSFQGKGPKGYKRSDDRIKEDVCEALERDHDIDASDIEVSIKEGEVTLSGTVTERQLKRKAEDCVERLSGVRDVVNQLRVQSGSERLDSATASASASSGKESSKKGSNQSNSLS